MPKTVTARDYALVLGFRFDAKALERYAVDKWS